MNNMPYFMPYFPNLNNSNDIMILENRINTIEKEIKNIKERLNKLENDSDNYTQSYQPNSYNMM